MINSVLAFLRVIKPFNRIALNWEVKIADRYHDLDTYQLFS